MFAEPRAHGLGCGSTTERVLSGEPRPLEPLLQQCERPGPGLESALAFGERPGQSDQEPQPVLEVVQLRLVSPRFRVCSCRGKDERPRRSLEPIRAIRAVHARAGRRHGRVRSRRRSGPAARDDRHAGKDAEHHRAQRLPRRRLRSLDQSVQGVRARLHLLLRAADAFVPGAVPRPRFRDQDLLEARRRTAASRGAREARVPGRRSRRRREYRRLPAGGARAENYALGSRGAPRAPSSREHHHQVEPRRPRRRHPV